MSETYTCDRCGGTFTKTVSDADARAESRETFGFIPSPADEAIVCDGCWKEFLPWAESEGLTIKP